MGHRSFCDSRFWRCAWLPSASAQDVGCVPFVYRVLLGAIVTVIHTLSVVRSRRDLRDYSDAAGGGVFDLVFDTSREQGLDQLGR